MVCYEYCSEGCKTFFVMRYTRDKKSRVVVPLETFMPSLTCVYDRLAFLASKYIALLEKVWFEQTV